VSKGHDVVGVLLAGGQSRRMGGGDKGLLPFGGTTLMGHVIERLRPQVGTVIINANGDPRRFDRYGLPVISDMVEDFSGPLAGVLAGMVWTRAMRPAARFIATAACDTPFLPDHLVAALMAASGGQAHPVFGLWPVALAEDLQLSLEAGLRKVLDWTARHRTVEHDFMPSATAQGGIDPFFNANTPDELREAETMLDRMAAGT
jgi:molybdopterin-guanine dinucleotide biosynthesis protein A